MPNKTIYIREGDLALWEAAQAELGESMSALFVKFLRERLPKMDAFVHVLHSTRPGSGYQEEFAVMFAPVGPTASGGSMKPHYIRGDEQLSRFLKEVGLPEDDVTKIQRELKTEPSVSVRTSLPKAVTRTEYYRLSLRPTLIGTGAGGQRLLKVDVIATPTSGRPYQWRANFHILDDLINVLRDGLSLPAPQLAAIKTSLLSGNVTELGGVTGAPYSMPEERLIELGLVEVKEP